jgi:hypothetical protein
VIVAIVLFAVIGWSPRRRAPFDAVAQPRWPKSLISSINRCSCWYARSPNRPSCRSSEAPFAAVLAYFLARRRRGVRGAAPHEPRSSASRPGERLVSSSGNATIDALFSRSGMSSMLTVWLVLGALSFAAIMESAGFLARLIRPVLARATTTGRLIASVIATSIGLNVIAGDQYVAIVMPSRVYRLEFAKRGIAPRTLSRTV